VFKCVLPKTKEFKFKLATGGSEMSKTIEYQIITYLIYKNKIEKYECCVTNFEWYSSAINRYIHSRQKLYWKKEGGDTFSTIEMSTLLFYQLVILN
jgi:hypothetical protein